MNNPIALIAEVAREYLGTRETSRNQGPHFAAFWAATNYHVGEENREPWCAAFVCFCVQEAMRRNPAIAMPHPPRFAAVSEWIPWARQPEVGALVFGPFSDATAAPGDILVFQFSHIGIVTGRKPGGWISTIEGNTNGEGSREGDGVYEKTRGYSSVRAFIRLPVKAIPK